MIVMAKFEGQCQSWHGHVTAITVAPEFHKQQLAKKLMNLLEDINDKITDVRVAGKIKFQVSLSGKAKVDITSSIDSKNELLRAVDLRFIALKDEVAAAFDQAIGGRCSTKDISDMENFAHHFGAKDIRDSLQNFVEMSLFPTLEDSRNINFSKTETSALGPQPSQLDPPIIYNIPLEKVAQVEQDSIEMEISPILSEDQPSVERSCAPIRSTTRVTALTIKSLNYFAVREKVAFQRDSGNSSDEEDLEKPSKNDVLRMSVEEKISLFESKQRDQEEDIATSPAVEAKVATDEDDDSDVDIFGEEIEEEKVVEEQKVAQVEQDSIEMEISPILSEDQPSVERSCAPIRSTTPRWSASPMRRIQIGRSGSRRVTALTIKSLNYFAVREKVAFQRDSGNSSDEEDLEKPSKND
nr:proteoglycan 4-like [Tanacetum cinerariifolium]